jgi:hypothetical protein
MKTGLFVPAALALALAASGCAYMPKENIRLEEARSAQARVLADRDITTLAPNEVRRAEEAFERALTASNTLQDPALVDHLAYVARQRAAIAAEVAQRIAAERAANGSLRLTSAVLGATR